MMEYDDWIIFVLSIVEEFASAEYQTRVWVEGRGPECSSFEEAVCGFFDDAVADRLIDVEWRQAGLTERQHESLKVFRDALSDFCDITPEISEPSDIVGHPAWERIRELASIVLSEFQQGRWAKSETQAP